ncbi:MAG: ROK family protein [Bacilli bacterium]|jgi:glucokinase|nr:ROK family protein [Bacilli bacterium]MDD3388784.1 ROK family protein [Bacilli bacterium]MDD4344574.1 ROK family protein [Bacilli bacterium]MDD4520468.1 ROK family protein [Bacilli bacterium]MDY0399117.1 ROK family protein [Bacilli bacterium]
MQHVISLDVGGTNLRAAIVNEKFEIVRVIRKTTLTGSVELFLKQIVDIIEDLDYAKFNPLNIVVDIPGRVRYDGFIYALPNIRIEKIALKDYLEFYFKLPTFVKNDAEMAGLAEAMLGVGRSLKSTFFITISTGVGGAYIENGHIKQINDEIGHTLYNYKGRYYEFEKICSGQGLLNLCAINGLEIEKTAHFFERVRLGDATIFPIFSDWLNLMDQFLDFIEKTYQPSVIALTGGVMRSSDVFLSELVERHPNLILKPTHFAQDSGLIGSACYGFQQEDLNQ